MDSIGRYEVLGRIGSGGFATVFRVRDPVLDSEVAVKVLADNWSGDPQIRERFIREAQILRRIDSDRVVTVHDIGELPSGQPYFVMALADRGTLEGRLDASRRPTADDATVIARGMADCVTVVHSHGLIHRDIKPSNLLIAGPRNDPAPATSGGGLLAPSERLVLGDFGLAKDIEFHNTGVTISAGSGGYAAPEQMALAGTPSRRTDLFAATAVMYRVLTGTRPPAFDLARRIVPFPDHEWWMTGTLGRFFRQGMSYEAEDRHDSIDHWLADFTAALAPYETPAAGPQPDRTVAAPLPPAPLSAPRSAPSTAYTSPSTDPTSLLPVAGPAQGTPPDAASAARYAIQGLAQPPRQPVTTGPSADHYPPTRTYPEAPAHTPAPPYAPPAEQGPPSVRYPPPSAPVDRMSGFHPGPAPEPRSGVPRSAASGHRGRSRIAPWLLALVAVLALAGGAGWYLVLRPQGPQVTGPDTITAGEPAIYTAQLAGSTGFEWTDPSGAVFTGDSLEVQGIVPGTIRISVVGLIDGVRSDRTTHRILVEPSVGTPRIEGPDRLRVGQPGTYTFVAPDGWTNPVWRDPTGKEDPGERFEVTPLAAGSFRITVFITDAQGTRLGASREISFYE